MVSNIRPEFPEFLTPTTESVRDNFQAAKTEIEALQARDLQLLPLIGGTLTGPLLIPPVVPTSPNTWAATKLYVDQAVAAGGGGGGGGDLTQDLADTLYVKIVGDTITGTLFLTGTQTAPTAAATVGSIPALVDAALVADTTKVNKAGDTMTAPLLLPATVAATPALAAATKDYVDQEVAAGGGGGGGGTEYLLLSGGTMTGLIEFDEGQIIDGGTF
jgi:hypothetical protein